MLDFSTVVILVVMVSLLKTSFEIHCSVEFDLSMYKFDK